MLTAVRTRPELGGQPKYLLPPHHRDTIVHVWGGFLSSGYFDFNTRNSWHCRLAIKKSKGIR